MRRLADSVDALRQYTRGRPRTGVRHHDADEVIGTVDTDDAVRFDPLPVLDALAAAGADVVVMGQVAGILHGSTELTGDLDLIWDGAASQRSALADGFAAVGAVLSGDDGRRLICQDRAFELPKVYFDSRYASGDCCTPDLPWDVPIRDYLARAASTTTLTGHVIRYIGLQDLICMRESAGRPKDLRRARELRSLLVARPGNAIEL